VKALDFLVGLEFKPVMLKGNLPVRMSNNECRRLLMNRSVLINGIKPLPDDEVEFPIWQLIFFPGSKNRTTIIDRP
jgi:hypothetical protein